VITSFGSIIAFSAYMTAYEKTKLYLQNFETFKKYSFLSHFVAGFMAEFASCSLWLPIDIIKERMQVQTVVKLYKYDSARDAMRKIHAAEGLIGLYRVVFHLSRHSEPPSSSLAPTAPSSSQAMKRSRNWR
jgi:hypothetical protein